MEQIVIQANTSGNLKNLIQSAVENQTRIIRFGIARTKRKLQALEKENGMESQRFYEDFQNGKLGDDFKYIDNWSLFNDFKILVLTAKAVLTGAGR
jgi:lipopolysaccharide/colanic/teichoic acid biosynthesis glycosyltransferase